MLILNFRVASKQAEIANNQAKIAQTRFVTETFSKAVEQLESDKLAVRLGAIYSLERIADSPTFYWMVVKVLNAIVRDKARPEVFYEPVFSSKPELSYEGREKQKSESYWLDYMYAIEQQPSIDIVAILSILGKPNSYKKAFLHQLGDIDLSKTQLIGSKIESADFGGCYFQFTDFRCASIFETNFRSANLQGADFRWAKVELTNFTEAILVNAKFNQTTLRWAEFNQAKLVGAEFTQANLQRSKFDQADLVGAVFHYADLSGASFDNALLSVTLEDKRIATADFRRVKNLNPETIKKARGWENVLYDDDFRRKLGLPILDVNNEGN